MCKDMEESGRGLKGFVWLSSGFHDTRAIFMCSSNQLTALLRRSLQQKLMADSLPIVRNDLMLGTPLPVHTLLDRTA